MSTHCPLAGAHPASPNGVSPGGLTAPRASLHPRACNRLPNHRGAVAPERTARERATARPENRRKAKKTELEPIITSTLIGVITRVVALAPRSVFQLCLYKIARMYFCISQLYDWLHHKSVPTVDTGSIAEQPPITPPSAPPKIPIEEFVHHLQKYILTKATMLSRGYPVEIDSNLTKAIMYVNPPTRNKLWKPTYWDVNASEFVPRSQNDQRPLTSLNADAPTFVPGSQWDVNIPEVVPGPQTDSGRNSWSSTPSSDSDEEMNTVEHICVRCDRKFKMTHDGDYLRKESCLYHWGRLAGNKFECCSKYVGANGCTTSRSHVWSGTKPGMNGPLDGYVRARHRRGGAYTLDTEMCYTTAGFELASIVFIAIDGHIVYKEYVKPTSPVVDYNTRFSGIQPHHLQTATKTLKDVQNEILEFVGTDTILIGHALENDLKALKLLHNAVVDTSDLYPHPRGFPLRRSLRTLSIEILGRPVKDRKSGGHSPVEDARTALDLVFVLVDRDRATAKQKMVHRDRATAKHTMIHRNRTPTYRTSMVLRNRTTAYRTVTKASNRLPVVMRYNPLLFLTTLLMI
ncbi:unnamed protein product [Diatraea saccharalis]|uniref:Exonuclease domain-containing protein n=1 Tax=Diatraea saccharalis TaxID=40085 RepID=A0A9N9QZU7_9NEOP|nr:unnamed protein product [Diatraea saccharalis]